MKTGNVDDGTHCSSHSGACVAGVCVDMPDYSSPTLAPASGNNNNDNLKARCVCVCERERERVLHIYCSGM